jgi:pyruvate carboxylase subunit A
MKGKRPMDFKKVLIANRGEIAIRIIRALRELNIQSVAIYSDVDKDSLHSFYADYAYPLYGDRAVDSYMNIDKIIKIAKNVGVDAIHPGYGFLAEKEEFALAIEQNGITFIGPGSNIIELMGNKIAARKIMSEIGIPIVSGTNEAVNDLSEAKIGAEHIGYPVLIKAAAGGGGIGMKTVTNSTELENVFDRIQSQASAVFGDGTVFIEKYLEKARHIEFQIIADKYGNIVHLGDRECSIQRRHQKFIEESPAIVLSTDLRCKMGEAALKIAKTVGYQSAGTIEFIYSNGEFYFLEMNTRLQVEHPVSEMLTGIDIVKAQIKLAAGEPLPFSQKDINFRGHVIECRICAEDPFSNFMPSPNKILAYRSPGGMGVRVDSGVDFNYEVTTHYDSMISKLLVWGQDRREAITRMKRALGEYIIVGPKTNIPYLMAVMDSHAFQSGDISTKFVEEQNQLFDIAYMYNEYNEKLYNRYIQKLR